MIESKKDFQNLMDSADFIPLPKQWSFKDWKLKIKEVMESQEAKDYIAELNRQDLIREQELERFIKRFGTKEKFAKLVKAVKMHYNSPKYCKRYYDIGENPPNKLEQVIVRYLYKHGTIPEDSLIEEHAGMFCTHCAILHDMLITVNEGQGEMHLRYHNL